MASRHDDILKVFLADIKNEIGKEGCRWSSRDLEECNELIRNYARKADPMSRWQIAEVTTFMVDDLLKQSEQLINEMAEVKTVSNGEKAQFAAAQNDVTAYILAKGGTPLRTKIANKYVTVDTVEIAARPYMNFQDLATGRLNMSDLATSAAREISYKKVRYIQDVLNAAVATVGANGYITTNSLSAQAFNKVLATFRRMSPGNVRVIGDVGALDRLDGVITGDYQYAPDSIESILRAGYVGHYKGATVIGLENPIIDYALNPLLDTDILYLVGGEVPSLKVVNEGGVRTMEQQNIDDESYEMVIRQDFGCAWVAGKHPTIGAVQFTA